MLLISPLPQRRHVLALQAPPKEVAAEQACAEAFAASVAYDCNRCSVYDVAADEGNGEPGEDWKRIGSAVEDSRAFVALFDCQLRG